MITANTVDYKNFFLVLRADHEGSTMDTGERVDPQLHLTRANVMVFKGATHFS